jgi:hypothetical protein
MANKLKMILNLFEGGAAGAGAAPAGDGAGEGTGEAAVTPGVLEDGTQVDDRLAARMKEQARKRKSRGETDVQIAAPKQTQPAEEPQETAEPSLEDQWKEAKKGKFKEAYARDVQAAVQDRFKNQQDFGQQLTALEPMLKVLRERAGVETNDELIKHVMDDDSLYEEAASEAGMTVEAYKNWMKLEAQNEEYKRREKEEQERTFFRQHIQNLAQQAEELKKTFPNFDLMKELDNEQFRRLTAPNSGLDLRAAYYAIHHDELEPQAMAYGIQRAQQQISQTLQANAQRPVEGAMRSGQPADVSIDPRKMTRQERQNYIERARRGEKIVF